MRNNSNKPINSRCKKKTKLVLKNTCRKVICNKASKFFKKRTENEKIYKCEKVLTDDFTEIKAFANSYFYNTHIQWNNLPLEIKIIVDYNEFEVKLKNHMWETLLMPIH